MFGLFLVEDNQ